MAGRHLAAIVNAVIVAATFGSTGAQAQQLELAPTVIVSCSHGGRTALATRVTGIETSGPVPARLAAALQGLSSCAAAFNRLARAGFDIVHRVPGVAGDFDGDGVVDGSDFLVWQRGATAAPAPPSTRATSVLLKCEYALAARPMTRVVGSETAGAIAAPLAAALAARTSCAEAHAALAGAGFRMVSAGPAPAASAVDAGDLTVWRNNFGAGQ